MTADSTISFSHFHGARSVPSTTTACVRVVGRSRAARPRRLGFVGRGASMPANPTTSVVGRRRGLGLSRGFVGVGHLRERQVFGEADRRQPLDRAAEDREEGAAGRMRPACAAIEPGGDAGRDRTRARAGRHTRAATAANTAISSKRHAGARLLAESAARSRRTRGLRPAPRTAARRRSAPVPAAGVRANRLRRSAVRSEPAAGSSTSGSHAERLRDDRAWRDRRTAR